MKCFILGVFLAAAYFPAAVALRCYWCSGVGQQRECEMTPSAVSTGPVYIDCQTKYCISAKVIDTESGQVSSFARLCANIPRGNVCVRDARMITCFETCSKDFCNDGNPDPSTQGTKSYSEIYLGLPVVTPALPIQRVLKIPVSDSETMVSPQPFFPATRDRNYKNYKDTRRKRHGTSALRWNAPIGWITRRPASRSMKIISTSNNGRVIGSQRSKLDSSDKMVTTRWFDINQSGVNRKNEYDDEDTRQSLLPSVSRFPEGEYHDQFSIEADDRLLQIGKNPKMLAEHSPGCKIQRSPETKANNRLVKALISKTSFPTPKNNNCSDSLKLKTHNIIEKSKDVFASITGRALSTSLVHNTKTDSTLEQDPNAKKEEKDIESKIIKRHLLFGDDPLQTGNRVKSEAYRSKYVIYSADKHNTINDLKTKEYENNWQGNSWEDITESKLRRMQNFRMPSNDRPERTPSNWNSHAFQRPSEIQDRRANHNTVQRQASKPSSDPVAKALRRLALLESSNGTEFVSYPKVSDEFFQIKNDGNIETGMPHHTASSHDSPDDNRHKIKSGVLAEISSVISVIEKTRAPSELPEPATNKKSRGSFERHTLMITEKSITPSELYKPAITEKYITPSELYKPATAEKSLTPSELYKPAITEKSVTASELYKPATTEKSITPSELYKPATTEKSITPSELYKPATTEISSAVLELHITATTEKSSERFERHMSATAEISNAGHHLYAPGTTEKSNSRSEINTQAADENVTASTSNELNFKESDVESLTKLTQDTSLDIDNYTTSQTVHVSQIHEITKSVIKPPKGSRRRYPVPQIYIPTAVYSKHEKSTPMSMSSKRDNSSDPKIKYQWLLLVITVSLGLGNVYN